MRPRRNQPSSPPASREPLSLEKRRATSAKSAPPRSATTNDSASWRARAFAVESGFGAMTICRNDTEAGRFDCWLRFCSQKVRSCDSDGGIGRNLPFWRSSSSSRSRRIERRWLSASQRRHSSSDPKPAARSCDWNSAPDVNCLRTFWTVCSTWSWTSRSVTLMFVSRCACCTSSSSSTI